jgi:hypothetical protein
LECLRGIINECANIGVIDGDVVTRITLQACRCELDEGKVVGGEFVVARCDPTALLDLVEETFDEVAGSIEV